MTRLATLLVVLIAALAAPATAQADNPYFPGHPSWPCYHHCHPFGPVLYPGGGPGVSGDQARWFAAIIHDAIYDEVIRFGEATRINASAVQVMVRARYGYHLHRCVTDWDGPPKWPGFYVTCYAA